MNIPPGRPGPLSSLRVLVVGLNYFPDSMEWHVVDALRGLGSEVRFFGSSRVLGGVPGVLSKVSSKLLAVALREPERRNERALARAVREHAPDLVLVLLGSQVSPKTVALLRQSTQSPIVCWCQDQLTTMGRQYMLGAGYDAVFVKDRYMQDLFSRMVRSTTFHYLPEACNPRVHRTVELQPQDRIDYGCDIMIAGTLYYYRQDILQQLGAFHLKVWGDRPDWMIDRLGPLHQRGFVFGDAKARAARAASIALNTLHYAEINGLNCRAFELTGCGAFQLMSSVAVLAEHFVPEVEVATFASVDELIEKAHHYLKHAEQAQQIAQRGQLRAHRDHTYEKRLEEIVEVVLPGRVTKWTPDPARSASVG